MGWWWGHYSDVIMSTMTSQINYLFRHKSKKTSKLRVTGLCARNSTVAGEYPVQMANNAENVCIWWRHHEEGLWSVVKNTHDQMPDQMSLRSVPQRMVTGVICWKSGAGYDVKIRYFDIKPKPGEGGTKPIFSIPFFSPYSTIVKINVSYWISRSYSTGVTAV